MTDVFRPTTAEELAHHLVMLLTTKLHSGMELQFPWYREWWDEATSERLEHSTFPERIIDCAASREDRELSKQELHGKTHAYTIAAFNLAGITVPPASELLMMFLDETGQVEKTATVDVDEMSDEERAKVNDAILAAASTFHNHKEAARA